MGRIEQTRRNRRGNATTENEKTRGSSASTAPAPDPDGQARGWVAGVATRIGLMVVVLVAGAMLVPGQVAAEDDTGIVSTAEAIQVGSGQGSSDACVWVYPEGPGATVDPYCILERLPLDEIPS